VFLAEKNIVIYGVRLGPGSSGAVVSVAQCNNEKVRKARRLMESIEISSFACDNASMGSTKFRNLYRVVLLR